MRHQSTLQPQDVVALYTESHLTMEEIGKLSGISRQGVKKILDKTWVKSNHGEWVDTHCDTCGSPIRVNRCRWRKSKTHYCNIDCRVASLQNATYKPWRQGQRLARVIVKQYFDLQPEHITHHKDGDNRNNDLKNLSVFPSSSDHMKYHRGLDIKPIWDGDNPLSPTTL